MNKKQSGFTLIEIAIVLVIIGLLLGGVLKGQEMITNGKIKRAVNDFNGISAAYYSYLDRYAAFPGDDPNALARWAAPAANGDGNGLVDTGTCAVAALETDQFWLHLRFSGLVTGPTTTPAGYARPLASAGGTLCVQDTDLNLAGTIACMGPMDGKLASIIDTQLDDGVATTGAMRGNAALGAAANAAYVIGTDSFICYQI
jgi:prepilin-type N-terminal cleavage/methylation domain-containing protein